MMVQLIAQKGTSFKQHWHKHTKVVLLTHN
jgi:hypothetical protein